MRDEIGECVVTRLSHDDEWLTLWIDRADPKVIVAAELLDEISAGRVDPFTSFDGSVLRICGINRIVVYRITGKVPDMYAYYAEWPD